MSEIPSEIMDEIKKEAFQRYLPNDRRPMKAWGLAMASLRCLKRDLAKNKTRKTAQQIQVNQQAYGAQLSTNNDSLNGNFHELKLSTISI